MAVQSREAEIGHGGSRQEAFRAGGGQVEVIPGVDRWEAGDCQDPALVQDASPIPWAAQCSVRLLWSPQTYATSRSSGADLSRTTGAALPVSQDKGKSFPLPHSSIAAAPNLCWL